MAPDGNPTTDKIGNAPTSFTSTGGARFNPIYAERCPVMWAMSETDLKSISALQAAATRYYAFGGFFLGCLVNIVVSIGGSQSPASNIGTFLLDKASWGCGIAAAVCFLCGYLETKQKGDIIDQIKKETKQVQG